MSSRTSTVRTTRTTTKQDTSTTSQQQQETEPSQDRCAHCKKFLSTVKAECRFCNQVYCMEHRHPETHSPTGCAPKAREQVRQEYQRESGHILGAEANDRGSTHRPGWNIGQSRQTLQQRLNQRVQTLQESSGRTSGSSSSSSSSSSTPNGSGSGSGSNSNSNSSRGRGRGGGRSGGGRKKPNKTWGTGGQRLGAVPGSESASGSGSVTEGQGESGSTS